jgi:hypothetical protein
MSMCATFLITIPSHITCFHTVCMNNAGMQCTPAFLEYACPIRQKPLYNFMTFTPGVLVHNSIVMRFLREEDTITFTTNLSEKRGRGFCRIGNEVEPLLLCRPAKRRRILDVVTNEVVRFIARVNLL